MSVRASQAQWADFIESVIWYDLQEWLVDHVELNRDLLEGMESQADEQRETEEALRGRNRTARELLEFIKGWASGDIPIAE